MTRIMINDFEFPRVSPPVGIFARVNFEGIAPIARLGADETLF